MIKRVKRIGILIVVFITGLVNKVMAVNLNVLMIEQAYGVVTPTSPIPKVLRIANNFIIPIVMIIGVIVAIKNWFVFNNKKKEIKSRQGQKLYGPPSVMEQKRNNDSIELEKSKNKFKRSIITLIIIGILWFVVYAAYIINHTAY